MVGVIDLLVDVFGLTMNLRKPAKVLSFTFLVKRNQQQKLAGSLLNFLCPLDLVMAEAVGEPWLLPSPHLF